MTKKLTLKDRTFAVLKESPGEKFTIREIAQAIIKKYPAYAAEVEEKSQQEKTALELINERIFFTDYWKKETRLRVLGTRPRKYYWDENFPKEDAQESSQVAEVLPKGETEHDLYPTLCSYLHQEYNVYPKRIDERKSSNTKGPGGNQWRYPDVVGVEDLTGNYHAKVKEIVELKKEELLRFWSFEVKKSIKLANLRESFFQCLANSAWAHRAYLVAGELEDGEKNGPLVRQELNILCEAYGIGFILLNQESPEASNIIIPAQEKATVNWALASNLAQENKDFITVLKHVRAFMRTGDLDERDWHISKT